MRTKFSGCGVMNVLYRLVNRAGRIIDMKKYVIGTYGVRFFGNKEQSSHYLSTLGVEVEEIEFAFQDMDSKDHNYAVFGIFNTFIFSKSISS